MQNNRDKICDKRQSLYHIHGIIIDVGCKLIYSYPVDYHRSLMVNVLIGSLCQISVLLGHPLIIYVILVHSIRIFSPHHSAFAI